MEITTSWRTRTSWFCGDRVRSPALFDNIRHPRALDFAGILYIYTYYCCHEALYLLHINSIYKLLLYSAFYNFFFFIVLQIRHSRFGKTFCRTQYASAYCNITSTHIGACTEHAVYYYTFIIPINGG